MRRVQSMREAYQSDLRYLVDDLVDMASMVRTALEDATTALLESDLGLAERVIAADPHIDERQVDLDSKIVELLARQSPVATDLRLMVAALRMSSSLERMGDLSAHIALTARRSHQIGRASCRGRVEVCWVAAIVTTTKPEPSME